MGRLNNLVKIDIKTKKLVDSIFFGNYKSAFRGKGLEFSNFREYNYGDDSKNIDWLVSLREGKVLIKQFEEDRDLNILFVFDISKSMFFGIEKRKIDTLKEIFYVLAFGAIENGDKIGDLYLDGISRREVSFRKGKYSLINIFEKLDKLDNKKQEKSGFMALIKKLFIDKKLKNNLENSEVLDLDNLNKQHLKNSLVFIFTDKTEVVDKKLKIACIKNDVIIVNIFDSFENTLSGISGIYPVNNGFGNISINLDDNQRKQEYLDFRRRKIFDFKSKVNKYGGSYLFLDEKLNIYKELLKFMKNRISRN